MRGGEGERREGESKKEGRKERGERGIERRRKQSRREGGGQHPISSVSTSALLGTQKKDTGSPTCNGAARPWGKTRALSSCWLQSAVHYRGERRVSGIRPQGPAPESTLRGQLGLSL